MRDECELVRAVCANHETHQFQFNSHQCLIDTKTYLVGVCMSACAVSIYFTSNYVYGVNFNQLFHIFQRPLRLLLPFLLHLHLFISIFMFTLLLSSSSFLLIVDCRIDFLNVISKWCVHYYFRTIFDRHSINMFFVYH